MLALRHTTSPDDGYPPFPAYLPDDVIPADPYEIRFARSREALEAVQRLRFEVFNVELGEGLDASYRTGRDEDEFDATCHHLMVCERASGAVVGTYRLQTLAMAEQGHGFYSAVEFDLSGLPRDVLAEAVEIGRACVAREHRSLKVLHLLWCGLGLYLSRNKKRYLFGCNSLTSQDPSEGKRVMDYLIAGGHMHPSFRVTPQPGFACYAEDLMTAGDTPPNVPRLMRVYLSMGARFCGPPALDRQFKTIDYLAFFDAETLDGRTLAHFRYRPS